MRLLGIVLLVSAACTSPVIHAQNENDSPCDSIATQDLLTCGSARLLKADARLNTVYHEKLSSAGERRTALRDVQRAWIVFRDGYCNRIYEESHGGNEAAIEKTLCLASLTEDRAIELGRLASRSDDTTLFKVLRALERAGYDGQAVLKALASAPGDSKWLQYAEKHCEFLDGLSDTAKTECLARLALDRSY